MRNWWLAFGVFMAACGDSSFDDMDDLATAEPADLSLEDLTPGVPRDFDEMVAYIIHPVCAAGLCHSASSRSGKMNLETDPYSALVGVVPANTVAAGRGLLRVTPCDPEASFLYIKLTLYQRSSSERTGLGANMPYERDPLPETQLSAIRDWIARGAPRVEAVDGGTRCPGAPD
jgi:hypothetical protein